MALPSSGSLSLLQIRNEFAGVGGPTNLRAYYRGGAYVTQNNVGVSTGGQISIGQFYGGFKTTPGAWDNGTPGYYEIYVPPRQWLRCRTWGGGGGGGIYTGVAGGRGGDSVVHTFGLIGGGGNGGSASGGAGGGAAGGNLENIAGELGHAPSYTGDVSWGGASPGGGGRNSGWPGGGGNGLFAGTSGGGGGGGGYAHLYYGADPNGIVLGITVGGGGLGSSDSGDGWSSTAPSGASGRVLIEWG